MKKTIQLRCTPRSLTNFALFMFFGLPGIRWAINLIMSPIGLRSLTFPLVITVIYLPVVLACVISREKRAAATRFLLVIAAMLLGFFISETIHPEYEYYYTRDIYGLWDYVFRPDNGIYAMLFILLVDDEKDILRILRKVSFVMYVYFLYLFLNYLQNGYWVTFNAQGERHYVTYSLDFGYDVLLYMLVFLYSALKDKKPIDWVMAALGAAMILFGGSRGPILDIVVFAGLYVLISIKNTRQLARWLFGILTVGLLIIVFHTVLQAGIAMLLESIGVSSRFITKLAAGNLLDENGRFPIWNAALSLIREHPLGMGLMGSRGTLVRFHIVGYPHQLFLELLIDFGVILGGLFSLFLIVQTVRILCLRQMDEWKGLFIIFAAYSCELMISFTFYHKDSLWSAIAVCLCIFRRRRMALREEKLPRWGRGDFEARKHTHGYYT